MAAGLPCVSTDNAGKRRVLTQGETDQGGRDGIPVALTEAMAMELLIMSIGIVGIGELV